MQEKQHETKFSNRMRLIIFKHRISQKNDPNSAHNSGEGFQGTQMQQRLLSGHGIRQGISELPGQVDALLKNYRECKEILSEYKTLQ